jgi:hypothetical protein
LRRAYLHGACHGEVAPLGANLQDRAVDGCGLREQPGNRRRDDQIPQKPRQFRHLLAADGDASARAFRRHGL